MDLVSKLIYSNGFKCNICNGSQDALLGGVGNPIALLLLDAMVNAITTHI